VAKGPNKVRSAAPPANGRWTMVHCWAVAIDEAGFPEPH